MAENRDTQTIFALATPMGRSGIAVIRMSGNQSVACVRKLAPFLPIKVESHRVYYGHLESIRTPNHQVDEVLLTVFLGQKSFTSEESVEISCHGNPLIIEEIQQELTAAGARLAENGEFTYRAFMNGRLDLVQAESVLSLIESQSRFEKDNSLRQLGGGISALVSGIEKKTLRTLAHIEADIDFSTEGLETMTKQDLIANLQTLLGNVNELLSTYRRGRILEEGFRVIFVGAPNVGKSSLLNLVLGQDRAIVTNIPGTTRDLIEAWTEINGVRVSWTDTAGLRTTQDEVEAIGIHKVRDQLAKADLIFWVVAPDVQNNDDLRDDLLWVLKNKPDALMLLLNKTDLVSGKQNQIDDLSAYGFASAEIVQKLKSQTGLEVLRGNREAADSLKSQILASVAARIQNTGADERVVLSRARHYQSLSRSEANYREALAMAADGVGNELIAMPLKEALIEIQSVIGIRYDEQIIDQIFKEFCLGK